MLSPQAMMRGLVSRYLPPVNPDSPSTDVAIRQHSYGEQMTMPVMRKNHVLADEGTYFVANNGQSGATITTTAAFLATLPYITIYNGNNANNGKSLYLDYIKLVTIVAGSAASALTLIQGAVYLDNINRYSSGGAAIANIKSPNMNVNNNSGAVINIGQITAVAASSAVRPIVGLTTLRPCVSGTVADVVGEMKVWNFGGVEGGSAGTITVASANIIPITGPPVIIGPGHTCLIYVFYAASGTPVAASYAPEIGYWER